LQAGLGEGTASALPIRSAKYAALAAEGSDSIGSCTSHSLPSTRKAYSPAAPGSQATVEGCEHLLRYLENGYLRPAILIVIRDSIEMAVLPPPYQPNNNGRQDSQVPRHRLRVFERFDGSVRYLQLAPGILEFQSCFRRDVQSADNTLT
jgi:hypothetical protein